jgi:hypothetical protein
MKFIAQLVVLIALTSASYAADKARQGQVDNVREAVFRYQFTNNAAHGPAAAAKRIAVFYLSVGDKDQDPSEEFLMRFAGHTPPVRKVSACSTKKMRVEDKRTGERGLIFHVRSIRWISDTKAEVKGGYYEDGLSASGNTYTVVKRNGKWVVVEDKMKWIS